jgi:Protein of unknown function (DUF2865)
MAHNFSEERLLTRSARYAVLGVAAALCASALIPAAQARDFFSFFFGGFGGGRSNAPMIRFPFGNENNPFAPQGEIRSRYSGGGQAYCVRTCDGRYFPISGPDIQSKAASCNSFCPASETKVVYGSNIDDAETDSGKPYSDLPNAFRYRNELVAGCTCNGKDQIGLAPVKIENDPTLRKGDIVAGADGLMVVGRSDKRGASLNFSPASEKLRSRYQHVPVVAAQ